MIWKYHKEGKLRPTHGTLRKSHRTFIVTIQMFSLNQITYSPKEHVIQFAYGIGLQSH